MPCCHFASKYFHSCKTHHSSKREEIKRIINLNLHKYCLVTPHSFFSIFHVYFFLFHRVVLSSPEMLKHPFSITLFGDWMYWTDWDRNAIFQADKFNGKHASLVANSSMVCIRPSTTSNQSIYNILRLDTGSFVQMNQRQRV